MNPAVIADGEGRSRGGGKFQEMFTWCVDEIFCTNFILII